MAPVNLHNVPSFIPSQRTQASLMSKQQQTTSQLLSKSHSMLSKIPLSSAIASITTKLLANSTTLLRQHGQISFMPCTNVPISHQIPIRSMEKLLAILMQIFVETAINDLHLLIPLLPSLIILYDNCFVSQASKLQTQATTEAEYIDMSSSLRNVISIMDLAVEIKNDEFQVICNAPHTFCKVSENNAGALELVWLPKLHPCIKHINVCYNHFVNMSIMGTFKISP